MSIASAQYAITFGCEMKTVFGRRTSFGGYDMSRRNHLGKGGYHIVHHGACTILFGMYHFTGQQRNVLCLQVQVGQQVFVYALYLHRPVLFAGIRFALMQKNTFDDTIFLGLLSQFHQTAVRIIVVFLRHILQPARLGSEVFRIVFLVEQFNAASTDGNIDDTNLYLFRKVFDQRTTEIITGSQSGIAT